MKKITLVALLAAATVFGANAQTRFGVKAGLNLADINGKVGGESYSSDTKMKTGFHVGAVADITFAEKFYFQPGLLYSTKGAKTELEVLGVKSTATTSLGYLEIPLNVGYRVEAGSAKVNFGVGPYLGFGLTGKSKFEVSGGGINTSGEEDIKWGNDEDSDVKPLDFGLNIGAGVEFSNIHVGLQYGLGLSNNTPKGDSDNTSKNGVIGISLGYFFGGSK